MGGLFTQDERDELRKTLGEELRVLGLLDLPRDDRQPYPIDFDAEKQLIAMAREGCVVNVSPKEFGCSFYAMIFLFLKTCWQNNKPPTHNRMCWLLQNDGWPASIEGEVSQLLDHTPIFMTPNVAARRVREAYRRRMMLDRVVEMDILLRDTSSTIEMIGLSLQKLVEAARG